MALDFDGTLAPIVDDPGRARAAPGAVPALQRLARHLGRLAVITGRPARVAVAYAGLADEDGPRPGLERLVVLGHYGLERWEAGTGEVVAPPAHPGIDRARQELPAVLAAAPPGTTVEDKGHALAVHTRRSVDPVGGWESLRAPLQSLADRVGLRLEPGRLVLELRPPGMDKGRALRALAEEADASVVAFAGDDLADLPAYAAVEQMRTAGRAGLLICSASSEVPELARRADLVVPGPAGTVALLEALAEVLAGGQRGRAGR